MVEFNAYGHTLTLNLIGVPGTMAEAIEANPSLVYLIRNGFSQSIGDAGAVTKKDVEGEGKKLFGSAFDVENDEYEDLCEQAKETLVSARREAKFQAILQGEVSAASRGPRLKGLEQFKHTVTVEDILKPLFAKAKKTWPTGKGSSEEINRRVAEYWAKDRDSQSKVLAKAEKLFAEQGKKVSTLEDEDLEDLL